MNAYAIPGLKNIRIPARYFVMMYGITPMDIVDLVCETCNVSYDQLTHKTRSRYVVEARQVLAYMLAKKMGLTLSEIGRTYLGGRDHTTVIHSIKQFNALYDTEEYFRVKADLIIEKISTWNEVKAETIDETTAIHDDIIS
jgi:chromosomal replication initiation ATPase DnaA